MYAHPHICSCMKILQLSYRNTVSYKQGPKSSFIIKVTLARGKYLVIIHLRAEKKPVTSEGCVISISKPLVYAQPKHREPLHKCRNTSAFCKVWEHQHKFIHGNIKTLSCYTTTAHHWTKQQQKPLDLSCCDGDRLHCTQGRSCPLLHQCAFRFLCIHPVRISKHLLYFRLKASELSEENY